jgi:signal transduction histidine kinase
LHLWYAAYLLMVNFLILKYEGFERQFLGMDGTLATNLTPIQAVASLCVFLQLHVIQKFFRNIKPEEKLYTFTRIVKYNVLISGIAHAIFFALQLDAKIESFVFQWSNKSLTATVFVILFYCVVSFRRGFKPAGLVFLGIVAFLIGGMEKLFFLESLSYAFPPSLFQWGLIIEAVILSFAMMFSYNSLKKEKEQLQEELSKQYSQAAQQIMIAQEAERKRIAEDLHDEIGSTLAVLKLRMQHMPIEKENLDELLDIVDKASANTRNISHNLMPPEFEKTAFPDLLQGYYSRLNKENKTRFLFICKNYAPHFSKTTELMLYRIIIEITKNILQHAQATEANIQLIYDKDELEIMAEDNGKGIASTRTKGIGLKNITSRVNYINGTMQIDTGKNGTTIIINVPYTN